MPPLPDPHRGDPIRAADFTALREAVTQIQAVLGISQAPLGGVSANLLALLGQKDRVFWCKITDAPPAGVPILPSTCKYSYVSLDREFTETDILPKYGRQVENDECAIYPALVGDLCAIVRNPQADGTVIAELWIFRENPVRGPCPTPG